VTATETAPATPEAGDEPLLAVSGLQVEFAGANGWLPVVEDVTFAINRGETLGLVGESGSGKTVSSLAILGLIPSSNGRVSHGSVEFEGRDLLRLSNEAMRQVRGNDIAMVFQEPMTSLNPAFTVGDQIATAVRAHRRVSRAVARARALEMLERVGIPDARRRLDDYPHALSGGMRQRAMIAMALSCDPKLLIADEPTTALDVTVQAQILDLMRSLQQELGTAILFVTHDFGVVADICDRVAVMYAGQIVEEAPVADVFAKPRHPYSEGLLVSMPQAASPGGRLTVIAGQVPRPGSLPTGCRFNPRCSYSADECAAAPVLLTVAASAEESAAATSGSVRCVRHAELTLTGAREVLERARTAVTPAAASATEPEPEAESSAAPDTSASTLLSVRELTKHFAIETGVLRRVQGYVRAVDGVGFDIAAGETLGLVGESGSGKSTVARLVLGLIPATAGTVGFEGNDVVGARGAALRRMRRDMQIIFQDPYTSLDPRATIGDSVGEPFVIHESLSRREREQRVADLLELVGLGAHHVHRYPHEFSGGQRQRIAVARALALNPRLLVCDEPVSSLDVSTQSQVINLLADLQEQLGLAYLFIAHDLSVVRHISHRIAVMYLGRIVEIGPAEAVASRPRHPYTEALISAIPVPDPVEQRQRKRIVLEGDIPSPARPPSGCRFHTRCPYAMVVCATVDPPALTNDEGTTVFCHLHTTGPTLAGAPVTSVRPAV
jgi:peptide/nickel transport system ATP-binding protein